MVNTLPGLVDTHCHLDFNVFDENLVNIRESARSAGVWRIVNPSVDLESSRKVVAMVETFPEMFGAIGVHPNDLDTWNENALRELRELASHPKVVAIGEIGLDYYWNKSSHAVQKRILRQQLELASELELPVILHSRESNQDLIAMLLDWQVELAAANSPLAQRPGVLHSFSGSKEEASRVFEAGFWVGIGGPVTFKNAPGLQNLVRDLPIEQMLIETDAPFLSPHPYRGKRNEPARVRLIAEKIADLKGLSFAEIEQRTSVNACEMFQWREDF